MSRNGLIYFLRCGDFCKIGFSDQPDARRRELEVGNPHEVVLVGCWEGTMQDERLLHRYFATRHHRGEWFHWGADIELVAKAGLPKLIHGERVDKQLAPLARRSEVPASLFSVRRRLRAALKNLPTPAKVASAAMRPVHVIRTGLHRLLRPLPIENKDESPENLQNSVSPSHELSRFIKDIEFEDFAALAAKSGVTARQASNAIQGRPLATIPYLRLSVALGYDPLPEFTHDNTVVPGNFDFSVFAIAFRLSRELSGHSLRDCAKLLNVSPATLCRLEGGDTMFVGVVLRACRYIGVHPFGYLNQPEDAEPENVICETISMRMVRK